MEEKRQYRDNQIGLFITGTDGDIAAWFNMIRANGMSPTRWVAALLKAWSMGEPVNGGVVQEDAALRLVEKTSQFSPHPYANSYNPGVAVGKPLFGTGRASKVSTSLVNYKYGWGVRGENGELIVGSIVNINVSRRTVLPIVKEIRREGHQVGPFVKSLIRTSVTYGNTSKPPDINELNRINTLWMTRKKSQKPAFERPEIPKNEPKKPVEAPVRPPVKPAPAGVKNPLLAQIG